MAQNSKLGLPGVKKMMFLNLDIDPKSHFAWTGGSQKILDKGRVSKYNKKFSNLRSKK
jgi:large subunit ribosomal protein L31